MAAKKAATKKTATAAPEMEQIVVTEEYLEAHPDMAEQGVSVGDTIEVEATPAAVEPEPEAPAAKKSSKPAGGAVAILKGDEYIRTYPADMADAAAEFVSKDAAYRAVADEEVVAVTVSFQERMKDGILHSSKIFSEDTHGADFKSHAIKFRNEKRSSCVAVLAA